MGKFSIFFLAMVLVLVILPMAGDSVAMAGQMEINRCVGEDDVPIYTDRACRDLQAREQPKTPTAPVISPKPDLSVPMPDCCREVETLKDEVRLSMETADVNRLAGLYHWTDATQFAAHSIMDSLASVVARELVDIGVDWMDADGTQVPTALWLDLYHPDRPGATVHERFRILKNAGCWWLGRY